MTTIPLDAQTRMNNIVADLGNPALADFIRVVWDSKMGYSYDLELQDLHVRRAAVWHLIGNLDHDKDPKYDITKPDGAKNRERRFIELSSLYSKLNDQISDYILPGHNGGGLPDIVDLDALAPIEITGWGNPNSPSVYGSPFHSADGTLWGRR